MPGLRGSVSPGDRRLSVLDTRSFQQFVCSGVQPDENKWQRVFSSTKGVSIPQDKLRKATQRSEKKGGMSTQAVEKRQKVVTVSFGNLSPG